MRDNDTLWRRVLSGWPGLSWLPPTVARLTIGVFFCISGGNKLFTDAGRSALLETLTAAGVPAPELNAPAIATLEFVGGGLLALGILSSVWAVLLFADMVVALATSELQTIPAGLSVLDWYAYAYYLPETLYLVILFWLFVNGPGPCSVDRYLARRSRK